MEPDYFRSSCQLIRIHCDHRWGFPCCVWSPMPTCHRHYPGRSDGACSLVSLHRQRPSLCNSQVGSCNCCFGTCSAFTHVMACTLAESPSDPFHRKLRQLRCLRCRFDYYRVERTSSRAGVAPTEVQRLSRRTVTPIDFEKRPSTGLWIIDGATRKYPGCSLRSDPRRLVWDLLMGS